MKTPRQKPKLTYLTIAFCMLFTAYNQAIAQTINIATAADLAKIGVDANYPLNGNYKQTANINLSGYAKWTPIGEFTGTYDGQYHYIDNLTIHNQDEYIHEYYYVSYQGLFSQISESGEVKNLRMRNVNINLDGEASHIGALAGSSSGKIHRVAVLSGQVRGYSNVGGMVGWLYSTSAEISEAYTNVIVQGNDYIYVLTYTDPNMGTIEIQSPSDYIGGLVGKNQNGGKITNSYATGSVSGNETVGGLVGWNMSNSGISQSYSSGPVSGNKWTGGFGYNDGIVTNSYWNITTSGQATNHGTGAVGKTDAQMKQQVTFAGWNFTNTWSIIQGITQPRLQWLDLTPLPVSLIDFNAQAQANQAKLSWQTAAESNNKEFIIYRSADDGYFTEITRVSGAGNSNSLKDYNYYDSSPLNGNNYYKLVQLDADGKETELGIKTVNFNLTGLGLQIYPNPTTNAVNISLNSGSYNILTLTNLNGKVLQQVQINPEESSLKISLSSYPAGTYLLRFSGNDGVVTEKVVRK